MKHKEVTILNTIAIILLWVLVVVFLSCSSGCSHTRLTLPDGSELIRLRFLDDEKIGSVSYDEGSFTMQGWESEMTKALQIIRLLAEKVMVMP